MASGDLYVLTVHLTVEQTACQFGQAYRMSQGSYTIATGTATAQAWFDANISNLLLCISDKVEIDSITFDPIGVSTELSGSSALNGAVGSVASQPTPANVAALIHLPTDAPNSKHNGRIFLPGIAEAGIVAGVIDAPNLALIQTWADELSENLEPASPEDAVFVPVVISRFVDGVKRVPPVAFDIGLPIAKNATRQQRSRMTRRHGISA